MNHFALCTLLSTFTHKWTYLFVYTHSQIHTLSHTHTHTHTHSHIHTFTHTHSHTLTHTHTYTHIHMHTLTHPYTHTHTHHQQHQQTAKCLVGRTDYVKNKCNIFDNILWNKTCGSFSEVLSSILFLLCLKSLRVLWNYKGNFGFLCAFGKLSSLLAFSATLSFSLLHKIVLTHATSHVGRSSLYNNRHSRWSNRVPE